MATSSCTCGRFGFRFYGFWNTRFLDNSIEPISDAVEDFSICRDAVAELLPPVSSKAVHIELPLL